MKTLIRIKSIFGKVLFEYEKEDNSIKETLIEAIKQKINLSDSDLSGSDLSDSNLRGSDLSGIKIKKAIVFSGLYRYVVIPFIGEDNKKYIKMGCYTRKLSEWEVDFWNNNNEFPNDGSEKSRLRLFAFETAKRWLELFSE